MSGNPLASERQQRPAPEHPMMQHAQIWKNMHSLPDDDLHSTVQSLDYGLPILGALASSPKTTAKDVIKAVSSAVAEQKMSPSMAVAMVSQMPADTDKLGPWLRERYAMNLTAAVHAKAALMGRAQPAPAAPPVMPGGQAP